MIGLSGEEQFAVGSAQFTLGTRLEAFHFGMGIFASELLPLPRLFP